MYLAIEYPELVRSVTVMGMTSCFGGTLRDGSCDMGFEFKKWVFSRGVMLRLFGTELQGYAARAATVLNMQPNDDTMGYFRSMRPSCMTRTPSTWGRWRKEHCDWDCHSNLM